MATTRLTPALIERVRAPSSGQAEYYDRTLPGFGLRVSYAGAKTFFVMTRVHGAAKLMRVTLGRHPAITLADAREKARETMHVAGTGIDPRTVRLDEARQRDLRRLSTFDVHVAEFLDQHADRRLRPSTAREYRRVLGGADVARWRGRPISDISRRDVRDLIEEISARGTPGAANLAFAYLRKFFNWCAERELIPIAPTDRLRAVNVLKPRERVLGRGEVDLVARAFIETGGAFKPLFRILLLTGQRRSEVAGMTWAELHELDGPQPSWHLPSGRTKNHRPHIVPLSRQAVAVLKSVPRIGDLVFSTTGTTPLSGFSRAKDRLDRWVSAERDRLGEQPIPGWTVHDLRRTMVTGMNEHLGIAPHVVEAVVNHIGPSKQGVAGVYNRALYREDRRIALQSWADWLESARASADAD